MRNGSGIKSRNNTHNPAKSLVPLVITFLVMGLGALGIFGQDSDLEKSVYKSPAESKPAPKKPVNKPAAPPSAPSQPTKKKGSTSTRRSAAPSDMVAFTFNTPGPNQEVWLGEMKLGLSNAESIFKKSIKIGVYLVSVKTPSGEIVLKSQLVSIAKDAPSVELKSETELNPEKNESESDLAADLNQTVEASENILAILARYADPKTTLRVTKEDWDYIWKLAQTNQIAGFTQVQIESQKWFASGQIELIRGNAKDALTAFQNAKGYMAGSAYPDYAIGETYYANNQQTDALKFYLNAVTIQPKFALAHGRIGDIYARQGKSKEAAASYSLALAHGFDSPDIRYSLAKEQMKNKRWGDAAAQLDVVIKTKPSADAYVTYGDLFREEKRPISAYEAYKKATELLPTSSVAFYKLGEVLYEEREFPSAHIAFEKALELDNKGENINVAQARKYLRETEQKLR